MPMGLLGVTTQTLLDVGPGQPRPPVSIEVELITWLNGLKLATAWSGEIPQKATLPALVVNLITEVFVSKLSGQSGLVASTFQVDAYAITRIAASTLAEAVAARLSDASGSWGQAQVETVIRQDGMATTDPLSNGSGVVTQRRMVQYQIFWTSP